MRASEIKDQIKTASGSTNDSLIESLPSRVQAYLDEVLQASVTDPPILVSLILFGSSTTGGFSQSVSDVDLIFVIDDNANSEQKKVLTDRMVHLESTYGFHAEPGKRGIVTRLVDGLTANARSFFICSRADLLSGDVARLLGIPRSQSLFVDRIVVRSIFGSAITIWGEELLPYIPVLPIRRFDVFKAFFGLSCQAFLFVEVYLLLPNATRYAADTLKRSVHNCFFCYNAHSDRLEVEVAFFQKRGVQSRTLVELVEFRRAPYQSFAFILRCFPAMLRLHLQTAFDNRFPR